MSQYAAYSGFGQRLRQTLSQAGGFAFATRPQVLRIDVDDLQNDEIHEVRKWKKIPQGEM